MLSHKIYMARSICFTFIDPIINPVCVKNLALKVLKEYEGDAGIILEQFGYRNLDTQIKSLRTS